MDRIDVHHHLLPPKYVQAWENSSSAPKGLKIPTWSADLSLEFMSRNGIGTTMLSLSAPATTIVQEAEGAASLAREVNIYSASIRDQNPARFGFFVTLPLLDDVERCSKEIAFAFDSLRADGVTMLTSYGQSYLGSPKFRPVWDELDRRSAVVFIHPTMNPQQSPLTDPFVPPPLVDFPHETSRTAVHLILSNTIRDHPNCKIILSHGGGTLPYMATRVAHMTEDGKFADKSAEDFLADAQSLYYDLALTAYDYPLDLLRKFAKPDHILYGSDFPFARETTSGPQARFLDGMAAQMTDEEDFSIRRGAALKLFPRLNKS